MLHELYMRRCFDLAQAAKGNTAPNPMVGAVLVYQDRIIGTGFHKAYGQAHAEVSCLDSVLPEDRALIPESCMYVNLEPCTHHGNTPPCAERLVQERVRAVVIAAADPSAKVSGRGIALLREHGVAVTTEVLADEAAWLNRRFFCFHRRQRPYIVLKWAQTEDGYMAPADRSRVQLSNMHTMQLVHKWRTEEAAILVGYHTALHDDPQLTARLWEGRQPLRIVLDRNLQLPSSLQLFNEAAPTWIVNTQREAQEGHIRYVRLPFDETLLPALLAQLHAASRLSLLVEGGAALLRSFTGSGLWDEARICTVPRTMGAGLPAPPLPPGTQIMQSELSGDILRVVVNDRSGFTYVNGMPL